MHLSWRAIAWGLFALIGVVIVLMLVEGLIAEFFDYAVRAPGRFLAYQEYLVRDYGPGTLAVYLVLDLTETAIPCCVAACAAGFRPAVHAVALVVVATLFSWLVFGWVFYNPLHELVGLPAALGVAALAGWGCGRRCQGGPGAIPHLPSPAGGP